MPRNSRSVTAKQDKKRLASLIRTAIDNSGKSDSEIAESAGIARSHLFYVLKEEKTLGEEKLRTLASVLNFPVSAFLEAAGFQNSSSALDEISPALSELGAVTVVTDPRFLDTALFVWLFESQFLKSFGVTWRFKFTNWSDVPYLVDETESSIGFFNRKAKVVYKDKGIATPKYWSDLCVYKGYALIARKSDLPANIKATPDLETAEVYLKQLSNVSRTAKPVIVGMSSGTIKQFDTPFTKGIDWNKFEHDTSPNPDRALSKFLAGYGDLFVGGLPQRYIAEHDPECLTLMSAENNPCLFSLNSLICSEDMFERGRSMMSLITSVWFQMCERLRNDRAFRQKVLVEIDDVLKGRHRILDHSISSDLFEDVFNNQAENNFYEYFPRRPADIVSQVIKILDECTDKASKFPGFSAKDIKGIMNWVKVHKTDPENPVEMKLRK